MNWSIMWKEHFGWMYTQLCQNVQAEKKKDAGDFVPNQMEQLEDNVLKN